PVLGSRPRRPPPQQADLRRVRRVRKRFGLWRCALAVRIAPGEAPSEAVVVCPTAYKSVASGSAACPEPKRLMMAPDGTAVDRTALPIVNCICLFGGARHLDRR